MAKISTDDFYYCTLAKVLKIENGKIHLDKNFKYTFSFVEKDENENDIYFDVFDFKKLKSIKLNKINVNEWYIISKIKLDLNEKRFHKEFLRKIIKNSLPILESEINNVKF